VTSDFAAEVAKQLVASRIELIFVLPFHVGDILGNFHSV